MLPAYWLRSFSQMRILLNGINGKFDSDTFHFLELRSEMSGHSSDPVVLPDARGYFGAFGGRFVPETLIPALDELTTAYESAIADPDFQAELAGLQATYVGRPTPISHARRLSEHLGGAQIYLKREDLAHSGAHKINNALGQALLARRMGKRRIIAETGAGQHGVASATAAALLGLDCHVYMGTVDMARQQPNVFRMNLLGSALGPHPYPRMVRDFQAVIGVEARAQMLAQAGRLPDACIACVGGGSNAIGLFHAFLADEDVQLIGVEAGGRGIESGQHAARFADPSRGRPGVLHGARSYVLQNEDGQILHTHSISAGLDYPSVGPEHAHLRQLKRAFYTYATDDEALAAFQLLSQMEGIIPALESAHAIAEAVKRAPAMSQESILLVNLSGRGDKDLDTVMNALGRD